MSPATPVATDAAKGPVADASNQLTLHGFAVLPKLFSPETISALESDLEPAFANTPFCTGDFYGARTKRFGRLLIRSPQMAALVTQPVILALAEQLLAPWCDTLQLNLTQATEIYPGAPSQLPHRDQDMWRGPVGEIEYLLNVMWPLTPFTAETGATRFWPASHGGAATAPMCGEPVSANCGPGDAIVFLGSTLHGAGANQSTAPRRGLIVSYCLGWLKPYENQWLAYPPAVARTFAPDLAALVGYRQHRPNLGNYEGQCPSILLGDAVPEWIGAVDTLRPDQTVALATYVGEQRRGEAEPALP